MHFISFLHSIMWSHVHSILHPMYYNQPDQLLQAITWYVLWILSWGNIAQCCHMYIHITSLIGTQAVTMIPYCAHAPFCQEHACVCVARDALFSTPEDPGTQVPTLIGYKATSVKKYALATIISLTRHYTPWPLDPDPLNIVSHVTMLLHALHLELKSL